MSSHRQIATSSALIGGSSVVNILASIIKTKVIAVLLGPAGVGLVGIYLNFLNMASRVSSLGLEASGARQIAVSSDDPRLSALVSRTLLVASLLLGGLGMITVYGLRFRISTWLLGDVSNAEEVGWLGLGVFLAVVAASQIARLQGLRRISYVAQINVLGGVFGMAAGIVAVYWLGEKGIVWTVILMPLAGVIVASLYLARLPGNSRITNLPEMWTQWTAMLRLGVPFMTAGLMMFLTQLWARTIILEELGLDAAGHFHASWAISVTYIGFIFGAMSTDYVPRLSQSIEDHPKARRLVNEQIEMALLLAGPVLVGMLVFAGWMVSLLYSSEFTPAVDLLRWQVMGDLFKVASWPISFILLARGNGALFVLAEAIWCSVYLLLISGFIENVGLIVAGVAFFAAYPIYLLVVGTIAKRLISFSLGKSNVILLMLLAGSSALALYSFLSASRGAEMMGISLFIVVTCFCVYRLDKLIDLRRAWKQKFGGRN